jgi:uridine phosphorylase
MPHIQPYTRLSSREVSTHVMITSLEEAFEEAREMVHGEILIEGRAGFKTLVGSYHGIPVTVLYKPLSPSLTAIAVEELARVGAKVFVALEPGLGLSPALSVGDIVVASSAIKDDGVSKHYMPAEVPASADYTLLEHVMQTFAAHNIDVRVGIVWSHDLYYLNSAFTEVLRVYSKIAIALDMDTATLYTMSMLKKLPTVSIIVIDSSHPKGIERGEVLIEEERVELRQRFLRGVERAVKIVMEALTLHYEHVKSEAAARATVQRTPPVA